MTINRELYDSIFGMADGIKHALISEAGRGDIVAVNKFVHLSEAAAKFEIMEEKIHVIYEEFGRVANYGEFSDEEVEKAKTATLQSLKLLGHMKQAVETQMQTIAGAEIKSDIDRKFPENTGAKDVEVHTA